MERVLVCLKISDGFITFPEQDNTSSRESMMPDHLHLVPRLPPPNPPHDASGALPSSPEYAQRKCKYMSHVTLKQVLRAGFSPTKSSFGRTPTGKYNQPLAVL